MTWLVLVYIELSNYGWLCEKFVILRFYGRETVKANLDSLTFMLYYLTSNSLIERQLVALSQFNYSLLSNEGPILDESNIGLTRVRYAPDLISLKHVHAVVQDAASSDNI